VHCQQVVELTGRWAWDGLAVFLGLLSPFSQVQNLLLVLSKLLIRIG
jgi:hypothetical protein